jgi:hypothetical protein
MSFLSRVEENHREHGLAHQRELDILRLNLVRSRNFRNHWLMMQHCHR